MIVRILLVFILFLSTAVCFGQVEQLDIYKRIYTTADSVNKLKRPFSVDTSTLRKVKLLDQGHPAKYFEEAVELFKLGKYNDAAFLYYLGILRYRFYNAANPEYQASEDGALAGSLQYVVGEPLNLYLKTNIDNFIAVLKFASDYYKKNDYVFYSGKKAGEKYTEVVRGFSGLIKDMEDNRTKYVQEWEEEKNSMIEYLDKSIEEYNKLSPEEKAKLKNGN